MPERPAGCFAQMGPVPFSPEGETGASIWRGSPRNWIGWSSWSRREGIYKARSSAHTPPPLRRLNDIAFSGDGEPTASENFDLAVEQCAEIRRRKLRDVKLVLITNASLFHRPRVRRALEILDANGGEVWAKLDAGTEDYYAQVNRSAVPWRQILDNLREAALARPIVIQSLFLRIRGEPPPPAELDAYCDRLERNP